MKEIYAEDLNYWRTGTSAPDVWIDRAKREIDAAGGRVLSEAFGSESGRAAFMLSFAFGDEQYRAVWPVLRSRGGNDRAAKIQAATMLYHDVKHRCILAKVFGARAAFFQFLMLPDGRTAAQLAAPELTTSWPRMLTTGVDNG